jgi:hypothetical protein
MKQVMAKVPAARGKKEAVGYDEAQTLALLARFLWESGDYFESAEMSRAAIDTGTSATVREILARVSAMPKNDEAGAAAARIGLRLANERLFRRALDAIDSRTTRGRTLTAALQADWSEQIGKDPAAARQCLEEAIRHGLDSPFLLLSLSNLLARSGHHERSHLLSSQIMQTTGSRSVGPGLFAMPPGGSITTNSLRLGQNGTASARFNTGVFRVNNMLFNAIGSRALSLFPIVIIRSGKQELARLYVDGLQPHPYDLPLWPNGAPKSLDLGFEFINDLWDPYSKADRNVTVSGILLY